MAVWSGPLGVARPIVVLGQQGYAATWSDRLVVEVELGREGGRKERTSTCKRRSKVSGRDESASILEGGGTIS